MYSHVRHRSLDETYINQLLNLFSTAFSSNSLKGDALAALRLAYPVASLRKCLPSGQRLFKACSGPSALAQLGFAPLEPPLLPPRARGAGGRAPPAPTHGGWGHSVGVKGPSPRRFASAGRTNPLTPTPFVPFTEGAGAVFAPAYWNGVLPWRASCSQFASTCAAMNPSRPCSIISRTMASAITRSTTSSRLSFHHRRA